MSGGEQQRVALGRALVREPRAFLMDEPLTNLDLKLRVEMRTELTRIHRSLGRTFLYVTNDQVEAMTLAQRMIVMNAGRMEQIGTPDEVYHRPATLFAASFIGSPPMNLIDAEVTNGHLTAAGGVEIAAPEGLTRGQKVIAGVRPERLAVSDLADDGVRGRVVSREALGDETIYVVETEAGELHVRMPPTARFAEEQVVSVRFQGAPPPVYDPESGKAVSR
jgi:ABC-type sugar transport system ATPase subunit